MRRWISGLLVSLSVAGAVGCHWPGFYHPGTAPYQRYQATLHDPYPDTDLGPAVVGGRPRDFEKPLPEPVRNRWLQDSWWKR